MTITQNKKRVQKIIWILARLFPDASGTELQYKKPWQLLIAVILSAQCTDKKVNEVTRKLFLKYTTLASVARATQSEFEKDIYSTGFYRSKTKNILAMAKILQKKFGGKVPRTMKDMLTLPGVARKTANVVLGNLYNVIEGITVDTHVIRLSWQLGLTSHANPVKIEQDLMRIVQKKEWPRFSNLLVLYGRYLCPARRHDHMKCPLANI
ncbi:endonuclease III [Candidatus Uhrbacteria bacterium]|nr:endonuclease III [Candidatus Uhrbacteria bacterium]